MHCFSRFPPPTPFSYLLPFSEFSLSSFLSQMISPPQPATSTQQPSLLHISLAFIRTMAADGNGGDGPRPPSCRSQRISHRRWCLIRRRLWPGCSGGDCCSENFLCSFLSLWVDFLGFILKLEICKIRLWWISKGDSSLLTPLHFLLYVSLPNVICNLCAISSSSKRLFALI